MAMVDGAIRMNGGIVLGVNESEAATQAQSLAADLWRRF
jgi:hypothetical protein